jgi:FtsH-binding integral membrane protein
MSTNKQTHDYHLLEDPEADLHPMQDQSKWTVTLRLGFIKKVYGILGFQLLLTTFLCFLSMVSESYFQFQKENFWLLILSMVVTLVIPCTLFCFDNLLRKVPTNYILLGVFTFFEGYLVAFICAMSNPRVVFMAAFMTFAMVIALTLYATTTKTDFTLAGGMLFVIGLAILMLALFAMFTNNKLVHIFISTLWVVLFGIYLIYDTQLIVGNKELQLSIDDYILASFMLYTDIINLFINLLQILSLLSGRE